MLTEKIKKGEEATASLLPKSQIPKEEDGKAFEKSLYNVETLATLNGRTLQEKKASSGINETFNAVDVPKKFEVTIQDYFKRPVPIAASAYTVRKGLGVEKKPEPQPIAIEESSPVHPRLTPEISAAIQEASLKHGVPEKMIHSIVKAESNYNPKAHSPVGAQGLMQLMPATAKDLGVANPWDIRQNIDGGVRYFKKMLDQFGNDEKLALAAYNAGPGAVKKYGGIPPYAETKGYVAKIMKDYKG